MLNGQNNTGETQIKALESNADTILIPEEVDISSAVVVRDGFDLILTNGQGDSFVAPSYFSNEHLPDLQLSDGTRLPGSSYDNIADQNALHQTAQADIQLTPGAPGIIGVETATNQTDGQLGEPIGTVESSTGSVSVTRADGSTDFLNIGDQVYQGDVVETGPAGGVGITLADTSSFSLGEDSEMVLDELVYDPGQFEGTAVLSLVEGTASYVSGQIAKINPDAVNIRTPVATIGIRGTKVLVEYQDGKMNAVNLIETTLNGDQPGEIVIFDLNGQAIGSTNQANIGWSWDGNQQVLSQQTYTPRQIQTMSRGAINHLPASLAEQAREAQEVEKAVQEAADIAAEEKAAADEEARKAAEQLEEAQKEAQEAAEEAELLEGESDKAQQEIEEARLLLEQLIARGASDSEIQQLQQRLSQLEESFQSLLSQAELAQQAAEVEREIALRETREFLIAQQEAKAAAEAERQAKLALDEAQQDSESAYDRAVDYTGYEANTGTIKEEGEDRFDTQLAGLGDNFNANNPNQQKGQLGEEEEETFISPETEVVVNSTDTETTYDLYEELFNSSPSEDIGMPESEGEGAAEQEEDDETTTVQNENEETGVSVTETGKAIDGYIKDATVWFDFDKDGILDADEVAYSTTTDANGNYTITRTTDRDYVISIKDGTDIATNKAFYGTLQAEAGAAVVTPLTTLLSKGVSFDDLKTAFGIDASISEADLLSTDPVANADNAVYAKIAAIGVQVQNTIMQAASVFEGADSSGSLDNSVASSQLFSSLASQISSAVQSNGSFDITDTTTLQNVMSSAANNILSDPNDVTKAANSYDEVASVISGSNTNINNYISAGGTGTSFLSSITDVATDAADNSDSLKTAINTGDTASINNLVTAASNQDPVVNSPTLSAGTEGVTKTVTPAQLLANASDPDNGDTLSVTNVTGGDNLTIVQSDGNWLITSSEEGDQTITFTVSDGTTTVNQTATINFADIQLAATNDTLTTNEDSSGSLDVTANDTLDGTTTVTANDGSHGTVSVNGSTVTYTPTDDYNGTDTFSYTITDEDGDTSTANVNVTITAQNDAPVVNSPTLSDATESTAYTILPATLLANSSDVDNDTLSVTSLTSSNENVTITPNIDGRDQSITSWTVQYDSVGDIPLSFVVSDGTTTTNGSATLTINDLDPVAQADTLTVTEDNSGSVDVTANDTLDGTTTVTANNGSHGTVSVNGSTVTYTPDDDYNGTDTFSYTITDEDNETSTSTVSVTVTAQNDAPTVNTPTLSDATEATAYTLLPATLLANASDVENDSLSVTSLTSTNEAVSITTNRDNDNNITSWTIQYDDAGDIPLSFVVSDGTTTANGSATLTVNDVDPVAQADSATVTEDGSVDISVLANDTLDGATAVTSASGATNGTLSVSENGQTITYTPGSDYNGTDTFSYTITDEDNETSTATVTVTVTAENDAPTVNTPTLANATEGSSYTLTAAHLLGADGTTDADNDTLYVTNVTTTTGTVTITPDGANGDTNASNFWTLTNTEEGSVTLTFTVSDGTTTVNQTATLVFDDKANVIVDDTATVTEDGSVVVSVLNNDTIDGTFGDGTTTISAASDPANGSVQINNDGTITYTPDGNYSGSDSFTYTVTDEDNQTATATVNVAVNPDADAPNLTLSLGAGSAVSVQGSSQTTTIDVTNVLTTGNGYTVTGKSVQNRTESADNVSIQNENGNDPIGFGVSGSASGDTKEIGKSNISEELLVYFDTNHTSINVATAWLASSESAQYDFYLDGVQVGTSQTINGGSDGVDNAIALTATTGGEFDQVVFSAPGNQDDYLINSISFTTTTASQSYVEIPIQLTTSLVDSSESLSTITLSGFPSGATLYVDDEAVTLTDGAYSTLANNNLDNVKVRISSSQDNFDLTASITSTDGSDTATTTQTVNVPNYTFNENTDDVIEIQSGNVTINGGDGTDTVRFEGGLDINFSSDGVSFTNIENLDLLTDTSANDLTITGAHVDAMNSTNTLIIDGNASDSVALSGGGWTSGGTDDNGYETYNHNATESQIKVTATVVVSGV